METPMPMNATKDQLSGKYEVIIPNISDNAAAVVGDVNTMQITTQEEANFASQVIDECASRIKQIEDFLDAPRKQAHELWKSITGKIATLTQPYRDAQATLRPRLGKYQQEVELAAQREQQRLLREAEAERARLQKIQDEEMEKERQRLADEAAFESQAAMAEAAEMEAAGDIEGAQAKLEEAAIVAEPLPVVELAPVYVPAPIVMAPKITGMSFTEVWKYEVTDIKALAQAVVDGRVQEEFILHNKEVIGKLVTALKGATKIPGITVRMEKQPRRAGAR